MYYIREFVDGESDSAKCVSHTRGISLYMHFAYTPGQKFIEFFFNELLHRDNGENQQFVNSGMETHRISTYLWNTIGVGAMATVQCP